MGDLRLVCGDLMKRSAYDQYGGLLNTTRQSIQAFGPRAEAVRGVTLLTIKAIAFGPGLESGVFSFDLSGKRGFQIGDPQKSSTVDLEVFDTAGHHIEISRGSTNGNIRFSQPELNRILTSLHAVSVPSHLVALQHCGVAHLINAETGGVQSRYGTCPDYTNQPEQERRLAGKAASDFGERHMTGFSQDSSRSASEVCHCQDCGRPL
jgi:hypothetical protein